MAMALWHYGTMAPCHYGTMAWNIVSGGGKWSMEGGGGGGGILGGGNFFFGGGGCGWGGIRGGAVKG
jgi:hypothetical protein